MSRVEGTEPVGYAVMTRHFFDRAFVELLMVGASFRRRGIATAMMRYLASISPTDCSGPRPTSQRPMRALLAAEGFIPSGLSKGSTRATRSCSSEARALADYTARVMYRAPGS